ncbi:MAG: cytochrome c [Pseudomonadales bacterium]|nr:cytochrome c [Pseudomonadales bacterium]
MNSVNRITSFFLLAVTLYSLSVTAQAESGITGKSLYQAYCSQCHGLYGDGFGVNSYDIDVAPRDHTDAGEMNARTNEDLFKAIKFGGKSVNKSPLMPNWDGNLDDQEINLIIKHLRKICCEGGQ